jgi:NADH-quinone oxidoreductase subunit L
MSATLSQSTLLTIALAPLVGSLAAGLFGKQLGRTLSHLLTIAGVLLAFILSAYVLRDVINGARFNQTIYQWMNLGTFKMEVGFMIDGLSAMMMCVVTFVSLMVHIYTIGYMQDDPGYQRFFSYISLFTFSMLMLVMSNNFLQLFFGWEAVGLVSYLLIGFWYTKPTAIFANLKAFLVNRVGDFGFILGIGLIAAYGNTLSYTEAFAKGAELAKMTLPGTEWSLITVTCICLFIGAMGKSAQFPLHVWLPDSMEGPTPISALIHAATMVTAGIFMVARMSPLYELSTTALSFIIIIGAITALFMGLLGIIQNDIKRVVAYSTLSQLGYMTVALGASAYSVAVFHLMTHAFFKALLFLAAGAVIVAMHHNQDIRYMGGLARHRNTRIAWITSLIGSLALIGTPFFSGFYSKDSIIEAVHAAHSAHLPGAGFALFAVTVGVFITAFYSFRMYFLVFHGKERWDQAPHHDNEDEHHADDHHEEEHHELPINPGWTMNAPLILLAIPSFVMGYLTIGPMLFGEFFKDSIVANVALHPAMKLLSEEWKNSLSMALHAPFTLPFWLALGGVVTAWYCYMVKPSIPAMFAKTLSPLYKLLDNKYYLDWFNENILARGARALGGGLWRGGDLALIDGALVNGSAKSIGLIAGVIRLFQTGYLYWYAFVMIAGLLGLMTYFLLPQLLPQWFAARSL